MRLLRRLLIGGLSFIVIAACVVGTACLVKRQVYVAICDAFPVAFDGPMGPSVDLDTPDEQRGSAYIASQVDAADEEAGRAQVRLDRAQQAIEEGLQGASPEEREIWLSELKNESPEDIRGILSLHRRLSPPQTVSTDGSSPEGDRLQLASAEVPPPRLLQPPESAPQPRGTDDALGLLDSSIKAVQSAEQVILNNIANANTVGFKRSRALFGDEPYRQVALSGQYNQEGRPTTSGIALGAGARIVASQIDISQGRLRDTQQALDLAIRGDGYFQIKDGSEFLYARAGAFTVNANGEIVLASKDRSRKLEPLITVPQDTKQISVSHDGIVAILQPGQNLLNQIGQIQLARFINPQGLAAHGENLFESTAASGQPQVSTPGQDSLGEIRQGALEESNVSIVDELAELRRLQEQLQTLHQLQREFGGSGGSR